MAPTLEAGGETSQRIVSKRINLRLPVEKKSTIAIPNLDP